MDATSPNDTVMLPQDPDELAAEEKAKVTADVLLKVKRVTSVTKHLPKGVTTDSETLLELSRMNRQQRRAALSQMKRRRGK